MSAVEVEYDDIKVGDRIRITREITVEKLLEYSKSLRTAEGGVFLADDAKLERLPKPVWLPMRVGSVVKLTGSTNYSSNWLLNSRGYWNSDRGGVYREGGQFEGFIERGKFKVEVIA